MTCASCGSAVDEGAAFCENCGKPIGAPATPTTAAGAPIVAAGEPSPISADDLGSSPISAPTRMNDHQASTSVSARRPCFSCGSEVGVDGYCEVCGTKQPSERDHFRETPASWVAGVCDRGIVHGKNEDAMALLAAETPGQSAVLVVLDGVSSSIDSDVASLAGARAARETLRLGFPKGLGTDQAHAAAVTATFGVTVNAANDAIIATTAPDSPSPASATFSVAVLEGTRLSVANIGDSRVYWLPDGDAAVQLTVDDSAAEQLIAGGMERDAAENGPQGHAITRWLGRDAPDLTPRVVQRDLVGSGWVLNCSDGLWNYASEPAAVAEQLNAAVAAGGVTPLDLCLALVAFATGCGGRDNITVALARVGPPLQPAPGPTTEAGQNAAPELIPGSTSSTSSTTTGTTTGTTES